MNQLYHILSGNTCKLYWAYLFIETIPNPRPQVTAQGDKNVKPTSTTSTTSALTFTAHSATAMPQPLPGLLVTISVSYHPPTDTSSSSPVQPSASFTPEHQPRPKTEKEWLNDETTRHAVLKRWIYLEKFEVNCINCDTISMCPQTPLTVICCNKCHRIKGIPLLTSCEDQEEGKKARAGKRLPGPMGISTVAVNLGYLCLVSQCVGSEITTMRTTRTGCISMWQWAWSSLAAQHS